MSKYDYNIIVIGGGAAGLVSSYIASAVNAKVLLIEKHKMGGDCLNTGCVPSKAIIRSAKMLSYAKRAKEFGFKTTTVDFEFSDVMNRVKNVIKAIEPHDSRERYRKLGVDCVEGEAKIVSPHSVEINGKVLTARSIIVSTGARPFVPPIPGLSTVDYLTSDTLWDVKELPKKLLVLGGGPIGSELAQSFSRLGSEVTIVEMSPQLLIREDEEVIELVSKRFREDGINVLTNHKAISFDGNTLTCESNGKEVKLSFDKVIVALGRRANVTGFGLETLGVKIRKQGTIKANPFLQTNIPSIYVCGDVTGPYQFTHVAAHQAWYACVNALFSPFKSFKVDYRVIPWATFTDPEVSRVGLNEKEAKQKGISYEVTNYGIDDLDRAIADSEDYGFVKVLTVPGKDKILGVTIVGNHAGDLIAEYVLAMKHNIGLNKILGTIHIYPTMTEANKYVAGNWKRAHSPKWALRILETFHRWRR
jgi:dihydrolipoamide dehydrogenase